MPIIPPKTTQTAIPIVDTKDEIFFVLLQNNDVANDVWVSTNQQGLTSGSGAAAPDVGIRVAAGALVPLQFFAGRLYAIALNAPVNLAIEKWPMPANYFRPHIHIYNAQPQNAGEQVLVRG